MLQDTYTEKVAKCYNLANDGGYSTPLPAKPLFPYDGKASSDQVHTYQQKVGSLLYTTVITHPDLAKAVNALAEFAMNPSATHMDLVDCIVQHLFQTHFLALEYGGPTHEVFLMASDAAFTDSVNHKSSEGYLCKLFGAAVDWKATQQHTVTTSTTEAELLALSEAGHCLIWWKQLFSTISFNPEHPLSIQCDNKQTVGIVSKDEPVIQSKLKHVDIHGCWLHQEVQAGHVSVDWIPTALMPADGLTKLLPLHKHQVFIQLLRLVDVVTMMT